MCIYIDKFLINLARIENHDYYIHDILWLYENKPRKITGKTKPIGSFSYVAGSDWHQQTDKIYKSE